MLSYLYIACWINHFWNMLCTNTFIISWPCEIASEALLMPKVRLKFWVISPCSKHGRIYARKKWQHKQKKNDFNIQPPTNVSFRTVERKERMIPQQGNAQSYEFFVMWELPLLNRIICVTESSRSGSGFFVLLFLKGLFQETNIIYKSLQV